uniref:Reverse transcriptase n=1 Tax=Strongyloides stercoralis TaxID=6248 RepID=A0A0K0EMN8_STRER
MDQSSEKLAEKPIEKTTEIVKERNETGLISLESYVKQLELSTRSIETQLAMMVINKGVGAGIKKKMMMSMLSLKHYHQLKNRDDVNIWREKVFTGLCSLVEVPKYLDYGVIGNTKEMDEMCATIAHREFQGIKLKLNGVGDIRLPITGWPKIKTMYLTYVGGKVSGNLPDSLVWIVLAGWSYSNTSFSQLFIGLRKLKVIVTMQCEIMKKILNIVNKLDNVQALICLQEYNCQCWKMNVDGRFQYSVMLLLSEQCNNVYWNQVHKNKRMGLRVPQFTRKGVIRYTQASVLPELCKNGVPAHIHDAVEKKILWKQEKEKLSVFDIMDILYAILSIVC